MKLSGISELNRALDRLPDNLQKAAEKVVLRAGAKPILKAAKGNVPIGSGLLKKSLGTNVKKVRGKTSARVGPRKGMGATVTRDGKEVYSDPNKYSHLVEFGTSHSAAKPFIRPAVESSRGQVVEAMRQGYNKQLVRVANRIKSKL